MGKLKYFLYILCGIFAFSLISCHDTFALEVVNVLPKYDASINGGSLSWLSTQLPLGSTTWQYPSVRIGNPFPSTKEGFEPNPYNRLTQLTYHASDTFHVKKGSKATLSFVATTFSKGYVGDLPGVLDSTWTCPTGKNGIALISCDIKASTSVDKSSEFVGLIPSSSVYQEIDGGVLYTQTSTMTIVIEAVEDLNTDQLNFGGQFFQWYRAMWSYNSDITVVTMLTAPTFSFVWEESTQDTIDRVHDEEKQQREEDEKKAQENSDSSKSSSDDSQKQADDASKNLFQVLTEFVSAISGASASSCSITGDFGFFNVGSIDLCTGASKVQPITTVIGTVMLIGLCIPAVVTLLHRFVSLYNEVMS